jgi:hypothetical protein
MAGFDPARQRTRRPRLDEAIPRCGGRHDRGVPLLGLRQAVLTGCIGELPATVIDYLRDAVIADAMWARFGSVEVEIAPRRRLAGMVHSAISRTILEPDRADSATNVPTS